MFVVSGGEGGEWESVLVGPPFAQLKRSLSVCVVLVHVVCCRCVPLAGAGEVVVSKRVWSLVCVRVLRNLFS